MLDGDNLSRSNYNVAETEDSLSDLIDRALTGERVIITRDGVPIIEFKPIGESELKAIEPKPSLKKISNGLPIIVLSMILLPS